MGSVPLFHNPYGHNGNSPSQIDQVVGTAYEVVREVGENLEYVKHVSAHMVQIFRVAQSTDGIDMLYTYIEELAILLTHIEEVLLVSASLEEILAIHAELNKLLVISDNIVALADLYENLDEVLSKGGTVIVSETPPTTEVQGRLWWENDSGNLFAWYHDGTSGQWVQINIASTSYDWTDILNKPSTFPPTNHTHSEDVKKIGDTMTGALYIAPPTTNATFVLRSAAAASNVIYGQMLDSEGKAGNRWSIVLGNTLAETGISTGSDFVISRFGNDGKVIGSTFQIPRSTGVPDFPLGATARTPLTTDNDSSVATTAFVKTQINSFNDIVANTLTVAGQTVIHVVNDPEVLGYSIAWGNGLTKTTHKIGSTTEGRYNTAVGLHALADLTTASHNTFMGYTAGQRVTTGSYNTAIGRASMIYLTTGYQNTALGQGAMVGSIDTGQTGKWFYNTGIGYNALYDLKDTASSNTGVGWGVMYSSVSGGLSGQNNSAFGVNALHNISSGDSNNAIGYLALGSITTGNNNIGIGSNAGGGITTGTGNVIIGHNLGSLSPTLANSLVVSVGNGTQVITGDATKGIAVWGTSGHTTPLAGFVGEYKEVNLPQVSDKVMASGVAITVCQLTLPPGDWDVYGWTGFTGGAATNVVHLYSSLSLTAAALDSNTPGASFAHIQASTKIGASQNYFKGMTGYRRMSIAASDIVYLTAYASFTGNAPSVWGKIWARRMR